MKNTLFNFFIFLTVCMTASAQPATFSGHTIADEGAWCWFADPRALHYESKDGRINMTYIGYIDSHGNIKATQVDYNSGRTEEVLVRSWFQPDDHDNPSFLVLPDERVMIIYSRHTDEPCFYYRISHHPGDITMLGEEKRLATAQNTTYPNPYILADDPEHIYMCWRGIGWHPTVAQMSMPDKNDDITFTWGPYQMVQSTGARPYAKYISDGKSRIYLAYTTGHPDNEQPNWLYCNYFDINDKQLYDIKGNKLHSVAEGTFRVSKTEEYAKAYPYTIVDKPQDQRDWLWNMAFDNSGHPVIGMTRINGAKTNHDYYYAKWNGEAWQTTFIANGGGHFHQTPNVEMCYSGGMAVDRDNPNEVYCSVPVNGVYEIEHYTLNADGTAVVSHNAVTQGSAKNNARPFVIEGTKKARKGASKLRLTWMNGDYYFWIVSDRYPLGYPTSIKTLTATPTKKDKLIDVTGQYAHGVDATTNKPYIIVNGKRYDSQNVLGTADSWKTHRGTTDGKWLDPAPLTDWHQTIYYDKKGQLITTYRNGAVDIRCPLPTSSKKGRR